jgi:tRNA acetyltransferase TAN1
MFTRLQALEEMGKLKKDDDDDEDDEDEGDIEAQIQRELAGLKPNKDKKRPFEAIRLEMPCGAFNWCHRASALASQSNLMVPC